ncbi:hypothetical protein GF342_00900 [Candidatus Woesearchaeota archaeon]|nr:hypothetical protein [Candidatus Woesearchaeota archaeon]
MRIPKRYGQSKKNDCPFCGKVGLHTNSQGLPVCTEHKNATLEDMKCACGDWLDVKKGKWGPYFLCIRCGPISFAKGMSVNTPTATYKTQKPTGKINSEPRRPFRNSKTSSTPDDKKVITVRSDELDFWF